MEKQLANQPKFISLNTTYRLPPRERITIRISKEPKDGFTFENVKRTEFNELGGAIAKSETIKSIICPGDIELLKYITEALQFNTSVDFLQISQKGTIFTKYFGYIEELLMQNKLKTFIFCSRTENYLDAVSFDRLLKGLRNNTSLTSLHLPGIYSRSNNLDLLQTIVLKPNITDLTIPINQNGFQHFKPLMTANNVKRLLLDTTNSLMKGVCLPLFLGLQENSSLTDLAVTKKSSQLTRSFTDQECDVLTKALIVNKTLTKLDISGNLLGSQNISNILQALQHNQTLTEFNFLDNDVSTYITPQLGKLIEVNKSLTALDLASANLTDQAFKLIGPALAKNRTITSLNLFMNNIGSEGCQYIAEGLKRNEGLIRINLKDCKIGDEGCICFGEAIKTNRTLMHLDITGPPVKEVGFKALIDGLKENDTLTDLAVSKDQNVPEEVYNEFAALRNHNKMYQQGLRVSPITILIQIGRTNAFDLFPLEIWLKIFKNINCRGVTGFDHIAEAILMKYDVLDLKSLCRMRIVTVNGQSHLLLSNKD